MSISSFINTPWTRWARTTNKPTWWLMRRAQGMRQNGRCTAHLPQSERFYCCTPAPLPHCSARTRKQKLTGHWLTSCLPFFYMWFVVVCCGWAKHTLNILRFVLSIIIIRRSKLMGHLFAPISHATARERREQPNIADQHLKICACNQLPSEHTDTDSGQYIFSNGACGFLDSDFESLTARQGNYICVRNECDWVPFRKCVDEERDEHVCTVQ